MNSPEQNVLQPVSKPGIMALHQNRELIISTAVGRSLEVKQDVAGHGEQAPALLKSGFDFTLKMLESIMLAGSVDLMADQLSWAETRLPHDGVLPGHLLRRFILLSGVIEEQLSPDHWLEISPYLTWLIDTQTVIVKGKENNSRIK